MKWKVQVITNQWILYELCRIDRVEGNCTPIIIGMCNCSNHITGPRGACNLGFRTAIIEL